MARNYDFYVFSTYKTIRDDITDGEWSYVKRSLCSNPDMRMDDIDDNLTVLDLYHLTLEKWRVIKKFVDQMAECDNSVFSEFDPGGPVTCSFCRRFNTQNSPLVPNQNSCLGCPIYDLTDVRFCEATPHTNLEDQDGIDSWSDFKDYVDAEVEFLKVDLKKFMDKYLEVA